MKPQEIVKEWFKVWEEGDFHNIPVTEDFVHVSPYGTINGKETYLNLVETNKDKFLGHRFDIHEELFSEDSACVRYTGIKGEFRLEVSEWYLFKDNLIKRIIAYYNIEGEINEERKLKNLDK